MCNTKISGYPSIDKPWLKYYSSEALHAQPASCTVYQNIYQHNKEHLSETALEYFGVKITFSKLFEHVEACAKALLSNGVRAGDCVTLCTAGTPEAVYIVLACSKIGALAVVLKAVPPNCTVVGNPGRIVRREGVAPQIDLDHVHLPDPIREHIVALERRVSELEEQMHNHYGTTVFKEDIQDDADL